jgi:hypothetical protein
MIIFFFYFIFQITTAKITRVMLVRLGKSDHPHTFFPLGLNVITWFIDFRQDANCTESNKVVKVLAEWFSSKFTLYIASESCAGPVQLSMRFKVAL